MNIESAYAATAAGHNLRDGMNYQPLNPLPLVAAPSAGNAPPQQSQYVHGTPLQTSAVASGITVNAHGLTQHGGITTSTPAVLSLPNQHSQGPTPASTPPAAPNDPKSTAHYPQQTSYHPSSMNFTAYNQGTSPRMFFPRPAPQRNGAVHLPTGGRQPIFASYGNHFMQIPLIATAPMTAPNSSTVMTTVNPYANEQYQNFYALQQNPSSQNYSVPGYSANVRPPSGGNVRSASQLPVYPNSSVAPIMYSTTQVTPMTHYQHQQPQQTQQPQQAAKPSNRPKNPIKIVNPATGEELKFDRQNDKTTEKNDDNEMNATNVRVEFATKVGRRALETTSTTTSSTSSYGAAKKDSFSANGVNGTDKNASAAISTTTSTSYLAQSESATDYRPAAANTAKSLQSSGIESGAPTATNSLQNVVVSDSSNSIEPPQIVNSNKSSANAAAVNASQSKQPMDYKRPTREESSPTLTSSTTATPATATTTVTGTVPATTKPSPSWPENSSTPALSIVASTGPKLPSGGAAPTMASVAATNKKIPKESSVEPSPGPVGGPAASVGSSPATSAAPSLTSSQDALKALSVTSTVVLDDNNESLSVPAKKTPTTAKQGTVAADEADTASAAKPRQPTTTLPQSAKFASPATAPSQSLPFTGQSAATATAPVTAAPTQSTPAQSKPDSKATSSSATPQQKPSSGALQTSGPISEKPSPIATPPAPFGQPFPSKTAAGDKTVAANVKEDKAASSSAKTKNRSKENAEPNVAEQNAKKNPQNTPPTKQQAEPTKPAQSAANAPATASKQTNGDAADTQGVTEGKSKKNKKSSKKEMINKKGSEKEGSDMDVFTEKPSSPPEKSRNNEKTPVIATQTNNTAANRSSKTNSSQKPIDDEEDTSAAELNKGLVTQQNIPSTQTVSTLDVQKTEQTIAESRPRKYKVEFLLSLRDLPQCKKSIKVANDLPINLYSDAPLSSVMRSQSTYNTISSSNNFMMPAFMNPGGRNSMSLPTRKSQQGRPKNDRQPTIHVTLSLKDDVPLRSSKDAWKPARLNPDMRNMSPDEKRTQELYKSVTGILNKLTPEKFDHLIEKIKNLPIDNVPRLQGVIDLIFDKAIDEPGFCKWYAEMCHVMQTVTVPDKEGGKMQTFRILLINKCQQQFERDKAEELDVIKKQEEIDACTDPEKKKELQLLFEETERKVRRKSVGNCRFIGELFKLQMLTAKIMLRCINKLLSSTDEESLECLCKLLTTIGKDLESKLAAISKKDELEPYFEKMRDLSENKNHKVSSRIRFMLQDVIDLRRNDWVPRREADNPKKIEQINAEHERKEQEIKMMNLLQPQRRGGDDYYNNRNRDFNKKGTRTGSQNEEEWKTVKNFKNNYRVDTNKFTAIGTSTQTQISDSLGPAGGFKQWSFGVAASSKPTDKKSVSNTFTPSSYSMDKSQLPTSNSFRNSLSNKVTPSSSMEKPKPYPNRDALEGGKISRSGSAQNIHPNSRESSVPRQQPSSRNASQNARQPTSSAASMLSADELKRATVTIFQEYDSNNDLKDSIETLEERFNPKQLSDVVQELIGYIIENKPKSAAKCGGFLVSLIKRGTVTKKHFIEAVKFFYDMADDLIIDCPNMWISLAEISSPLIAEDCLQFNDLQTEFPNKTLLDLVKTSSEAPVNKDSTLKKFLLDCLKADNSDEIIKWIDANFENSRNSPALVAKLTTIICEIVHDEWNKEGKKADESSAIEGTIKKYGKLFKIYIENKSDLEMQCLLAVNDYVAKASYPSGFIQKIFELLHELELVSYDSFIQWRTTPMVGVAMGSLRQFFNYLKDTQQNEENANH